MKQFYFLSLFSITTAFCFAQDSHIELEANYNHHIRKVHMPHDVVCKVKKEKWKLRGSLFGLKNDTFFFKQYYTNDTFRICWKNVEWLRFKRKGFVSVIYDGWMVTTWTLTGIGVIFMYEGIHAHPGGEGGGYVAAAGLGLFIISFPPAIVSTLNRFRKYNPEEYQIRIK